MAVIDDESILPTSIVMNPLYRLSIPLVLLMLWIAPVNAQTCDVGVDALELDACCFDLFITNDEVGLTISAIQANVLSPTDTIVSSVQPTTWGASRTARSLTWVISGGLGTGDFDFAGLCMYASDGTSRVEFVYRNQAGGIACRDTIDLDCIPIVSECLDFRTDSIRCVTPAAGGRGQEMTFTVTSLDSCPKTSLTLSVAGPAGITVSPSTIPLSPALSIFDSAANLKATFTGSGLATTTTLTLVVRANGAGCTCTDTITVFLANCAERCFDLRTDSLICRPASTGAPGYDWTITLTNRLDCPITTLGARIASPSSGVAISPMTTPIAPGLDKGASKQFTFRIDGGVPSSTISVGLSPSGALCQCDSIIMLTLPDCPSTTDTGCVRIVSREVICDPQGDPGDYRFMFDVVNNSGKRIDSIVFFSQTPNLIFDPSPYVLATPVPPSGTAIGETIGIRQGAAGLLPLMSEAYGEGAIVCGDTLSIFLPECVTSAPGDREVGMVMAVRPNPARDRAEIALHVTNAIREGRIDVVDARGNVVLRLPLRIGLEAGNHRFSLDVSQLPAGAYLVQLVGDDRALHRPLRITR